MAPRSFYTRANLDKDPVEIVGNLEAIIKGARKKKKVSTTSQVEVASPVLLKA